AKRDGFGDVLADGARVAAEKIGGEAEDYAIHIQGQELPMHDPRFEPGLGLIYQIDATPGRHTQASQYIAPVGLDRDIPAFGENREEQEGRGRHLKVLSALTHVMNASGMCLFGYLSTEVTFLPEFLTAITGHSYSLEDLVTVGERIADIRQAFNVREGINALAFSIPKRAYGMPPLEEGPTAGVTVEIDTLLKEHLEEMDWDPESAKPNAERLIELGMEDVAQDLWD
ncbi:MAG: aldehyde ferredoxin oxidoreductase C-terminal domain-containing protein, partial [Chloroflexota bacterium]